MSESRILRITLIPQWKRGKNPCNPLIRPIAIQTPSTIRTSSSVSPYSWYTSWSISRLPEPLVSAVASACLAVRIWVTR
ncbi:MAG: hypothetical protein R2825_15090 [Saprospiraceae bacterium]